METPLTRRQQPSRGAKAPKEDLFSTPKTKTATKKKTKRTVAAQEEREETEEDKAKFSRCLHVSLPSHGIAYHWWPSHMPILCFPPSRTLLPHKGGPFPPGSVS